MGKRNQMFESCICWRDVYPWNFEDEKLCELLEHLIQTISSEAYIKYKNVQRLSKGYIKNNQVE